MANQPENASTFKLAVALASLLLIAAAVLFYVQTSRSDDGGNSATLAVVAHAQRLPLLADAAFSGSSASMTRLAEALDELRRRRQTAGLGSGADFDELERATAEFLAGQAAVDAWNTAQAAVADNVGELEDGADSLLDASGATAELLSFQQRAASLRAAVSSAFRSGDAQTAETITRDLDYMRQVVDALGGQASALDVAPLETADQETYLAPLQSALDRLEAALTPALADAATLSGAGQHIAAMRNAAQRIYDAAPSASAGSRAGGLLGSPLIPISLLGVALLLLLSLIALHSKSGASEKKAREHAAQNERNQQAILRLLDELGSLADGDLTVEATVTEDITGAIADSINYAIEKLRELVATINDTSIMVDSAAKQTESTAVHMARAADNQSREISAATESIVSMAASIEEVSGNAERSSDVARHSVEVAHKGGEAVRRTIDGMNTIRETIQETSKRIKRLGESSQEIGNIVELINDIAEQTNILALNASIQASMAGEAGRGFAVVADEVQRLAERSTNATKQIEVLVRTIQADTNEAVVSMERSTTDVVGGALLAENAGAALDEIEQVSNQIANLVQNISGSAREQAGSAADVTRRTTKLKEISEQTGKATTATAASISKLSVLASQLRGTVSGFTLPSAALKASPLAAVPTNESPPSPEPVEESAAG